MLLVDTGVLVAAADTDDAYHQPCKALLEDDPGPLVTTAMVIAEAAYLLDRQLGPRAEAALFASITDGNLRVDNLGEQDWARIGELVTTYANLRLGGTDASLVALAGGNQVSGLGVVVGSGQRRGLRSAPGWLCWCQPRRILLLVLRATRGPARRAGRRGGRTTERSEGVSGSWCSPGRAAQRDRPRRR